MLRVAHIRKMIVWGFVVVLLSACGGQQTAEGEAEPNTVPTATAQSITMDEDSTKTITLSGTDADNDTLTYTVVTSPSHGTLSGTAPNVLYTPDTGYAGEDSFTFMVNDGTHDSSMATINLTMASLASNGYADLGQYTPILYDNGKEGDNKYIAYYPEGTISTDMPVVMFIKGGGGSVIENYSGIMKFMASKGYFVMGVDANSYASWYITQKLEIALNEMKALYGLTVPKLVIMGHSLGGGQTFYAMKKFRDDGYGNQGSLALSIDGWFSFDMNETDLKQLDSNVSFLQMNGIHGTGTDPRIDLKIWDLSTQANKTFYTLAENNHGYVKGDLDNILIKDDLRLMIGALTANVINGSNNGKDAIPEDNKASYLDIYNALGDKASYDDGDCAGIRYNAISVIENNDIDYCTLASELMHYPETTTLESRATDENIVRPSVGHPSNDDVYGTTITKVNKSDSAIANYPKVQSWNSDMSLIRIHNIIYDANSLEETDISKNKTEDDAYATLCSRASDYFRWSNKVPNRFFAIDSFNQFIQGEITGNDVNCSKVLESFSDYEVVHMGPHEGNIDYDDKYVVFVAKKQNLDTFYVILYDIQNHERIWTKTMPSQTWVMDNHGTWQPSTLDWISVSPSGKYIVFNNHNGNNDGIYRYDINLENKTKLQYRWDGDGQLYSEDGHGDMGYDSEGNEVYVEFVSGLGVYSFNLDSPNELGKRLLQSPYGGGHVSCRNTRRPGWCYVTTVETNYKRVFALKLDGTGEENVQNFSQTHINNGYDETYGGASPDGTKIIFNSQWGEANIGTFIVEAQ